MPEGLMQFLPLVLIFGVMYFLIIRPQSKKQKEHQNMINAVKKGDRIVTNGGLIGKVSQVSEKELQLEVASGVQVQVLRSMISTVLSATSVSQSVVAPKSQSVAPAKKAVPAKVAKPVKAAAKGKKPSVVKKK